MSTGLGSVQRHILRSLMALPPGSGVYVVPDGATPAQSAAYRRAAHSLARAGRVRLEHTIPRLGRAQLGAYLVPVSLS